MSTLTAGVLVGGLLAAIALHDRLAVRRIDRRNGIAADSPTTDTSEDRMTMSKQQLQTLGLSHVRREIAKGKYSPADVKRWKGELGDAAVEKILEAKAASTPASKPEKTATTTKE